MTDHQPPVQDDITILLRAQKIIEHKEVRVNVSVTAQIDPATTESEFRNELQSTLQKFITTDWKIQSIQRSKGTGIYEYVSVSATARVPESENYKLQERAGKVSRIGFELVNPSVDYSLTFDQVQEINAGLRATLVSNALTEVNALNALFQKEGVKGVRQFFRVAHVGFNEGDSAPLHINQMAKAYSGSVSNAKDKGPFRAQAMMATSASPTGSGSSAYEEVSFEDDAADEAALIDMNVSTRFSMTGSFTLRAFAVPYS